MAKKDIAIAQKLGQVLRVGPRVPRIKNWSNLVDELKKLKVTPGEAYRIVADKKDTETNIRFEWKMMRFTFFVWERVTEDSNKYLKPKIDTIRAIVRRPRYRAFFEGYFPDLEFNEEKEIKLLNKLIAEKPQRAFFKEGYYVYEGSRSKRLIPQKHLDYILWGNK